MPATDSSGRAKPPTRRGSRLDVRAWWLRNGWRERIAVVGVIVIAIGSVVNFALGTETIHYTGTFVATGSMSTPRAGATATLLPDGRVLIAGGTSGPGASTALASAEIYDLRSGTFTPTGSMAAPRTNAGALALPDGRVLIAGGFGVDGSGAAVVLATAELFNPATGTFATTGSMSVQRALASMVLLADGRILVAGGESGSSRGTTELASAEIYDPGTGTFSATGSMHVSREAASAALLPDGQVLVAGGSTSSDAAGGAVTATAELFNPATGTFSTTGSMASGLARRSAALTLFGTVLLVGGLGPNAGAGTTSTDVYDPTTRTFLAAAPMHTARIAANLVTLVDGNLLVAGGPGPAELFDLDKGTFSTTGTMLQPRVGATATILPRGEVLFAGGTVDGAPVASAELYH